MRKSHSWYGPDPIPGDMLRLVGVIWPGRGVKDMFVGFQNKKTGDVVAMRDGIRLEIRCMCHKRSIEATYEIRHRMVQGFPHDSYLNFGKWAITKEKFRQRHSAVTAKVLFVPRQ